jgi:hypothetical protein
MESFQALSNEFTLSPVKVRFQEIRVFSQLKLLPANLLSILPRTLIADLCSTRIKLHAKQCSQPVFLARKSFARGLPETARTARSISWQTAGLSSQKAEKARVFGSQRNTCGSFHISNWICELPCLLARMSDTQHPAHNP